MMDFRFLFELILPAFFSGEPKYGEDISTINKQEI
jgi:hypothetical protein